LEKVTYSNALESFPTSFVKSIKKNIGI
jgi:hypothetical protein